VATVGDVTITENALSAFTELFFFMYGYDSSSVDEAEMNLYKADSLDTMIQVAAMEQYYEGQDIFPEDVDTRFDQFKAMIDQTAGVSDTFNEKGITDDTLKYYVNMQFYFQALSAEATDDGALPTEADIEAYYNAHEDEFPDVEERRIRHILVGTAELTDEDRQLAEEIREKIVSGQETFEDMAREYGTDGTSAEGGDLGYHEKGYYVEAFGEAAFALPVNEVSDIVESEFGFHIVEVTDIRKLRSLEAQSETIRSTLTYEICEEKMNELVEAYGASYLSDKYPAPDARNEVMLETEADDDEE
jgi:parvulin-like peptidyl-prolyl isomerase